MSDRQTGFFDSLIAAARVNPLSAALIGGGALWLLVGDERLKGAARSAVTAATDVVDSGTSSLATAASELRRTAAPPMGAETDRGGGGARGTLRAATGAAADSMSEAGENVRDRFDEGVAFAREQFGKLDKPLPVKETLTKAQSSLGDMLERQPLVLGAVGLAIGAAVAGAFRTSDIEDQYIGGISDDVMGELSKRGTQVSKALREAADTVIAEVSDTGAEAMDRVKQAGTDAAQTAKGKVNSS
ncbi:hypothetical protein [Bradyrhizobium genosp. P]|uniref:hypothetical protein n=1 Tax=Bradyrhizobium genosp. P TaxID=83641 RepID=UPI003CE79A58